MESGLLSGRNGVASTSLWRSRQSFGTWPPCEVDVQWSTRCTQCPPSAHSIVNMSSSVSAPSGAGSPLVQTSSPPPILALLPLLTYTFSAATSAIGFFYNALISILLLTLTPFNVIIPALSYALAPFIISLQLLFESFVLTPYRVTVYVLQAIYPLYAFVGVAVVFGAVVGLGARLIVGTVGKALLGGPRTSTSTNVVRKRERSRTPLAQRRGVVKGKRRVTVKEEPAT
ncbi:hypothetical protein FA95DRAFT_1556761 [Auriscalpium vulgare]|uniref:Uncharacterized protein n=1 Tax=Auriscalpium vulgare TaxID=40419 RepID=A0ACB8S040_9AGAM|nr:hypothetical protein FA95DRAFT_1556761 [Auriscalpium vulgare]